MGPFARKAIQEVRRFGQKANLGAAQTFGRKITSVAQHRGNQLSNVANQVASHADVAGMSGVADFARRVGHGASEIAHTARLLDQNQPRAAVDRVLTLLGKNH